MALREELHAEERREALCLHEASHYVVARAMDLDPEGCRVDLEGIEGEMAYSYALGEGFSPEGRRRLLAVAFAGHVGERIRFGTAPIEDMHAADNGKADELLAREPRDRRARAQAEAMGVAADALRAEWPLVCALAAELRERGRWGVPA